MFMMLNLLQAARFSCIKQVKMSLDVQVKECWVM